MAELGWILALPAILIIVGILFVAQYKLAIKERKWMMLIIPAVILVTFLGSFAMVLQASRGYQVTTDFEWEDGHGNILKLTMDLSQGLAKTGNTITRFSNLMIYNKDQVLVDEIHLSYKNNKPEMEGEQLVYDKYIQQMINHRILNGAKLDGSSWDQELITDGTPFLGGTLTINNPLKFLAIMCGIPFLLILFAGILPRFMNRKKIRARALAKVDIQSLDNDK